MVIFLSLSIYDKRNESTSLYQPFYHPFLAYPSIYDKRNESTSLYQPFYHPLLAYPSIFLIKNLNDYHR